MPESSSNEVAVKLPQKLLNELDGVARRENMNRSELLHRAISMYLQDHNKRHIRESMCQGYMEMAKINLKIASESFLAEEEAEVTLERLVSGV